MGTLALILVPAALFVAVVALVLAVRQRGAPALGRPLWSRPAIWIGLAMAFVLLGVFVFPRLLGFTFLFLPFVWMRGFGRRPPQSPDR